jgi:hypothetical protein
MIPAPTCRHSAGPSANVPCPPAGADGIPYSSRQIGSALDVAALVDVATSVTAHHLHDEAALGTRRRSSSRLAWRRPPSSSAWRSFRAIDDLFALPRACRRHALLRSCDDGDPIGRRGPDRPPVRWAPFADRPAQRVGRSAPPQALKHPATALRPGALLQRRVASPRPPRQRGRRPGSV